MKRLLNAGLILLVMLAALRPASGQEQNAAAQASVESWLSLVDKQQYADSWQAAAGYFKNAITAQQWQDAASRARGPLGALKSREVKSVTAAKTLPGAPDGDYVVFQFNTTFERKAAAVETVTAIHEPDSNWRVVGYFVR